VRNTNYEGPRYSLPPALSLLLSEVSTIYPALHYKNNLS